MKIFRIFLRVIFVTIMILLFEGLCFRFAEDYANFKVKLFWGEINTIKGQELGWSLPFDGLDSEPPVSPINTESHSVRLAEEYDYVSEVTKFGRPIRDKYSDYCNEVKDPLKNYDIRNFNNVSGLIFPKLVRQATEEDIQKNFARRVGDTLEYSRAIFIYVVTDEVSYLENLDSTQKTFGFLLNENIACMKVSISSTEDLKQKISFLRNEAPLQSESLILWGSDQAASNILELVCEEPGLVSLAVVKDPIDVNYTPSGKDETWVYSFLTDTFLKDTKTNSLHNLIKITEHARESNFLFGAKLGGLIRKIDETIEGNLPAEVIPCLLSCVEFASIKSRQDLDEPDRIIQEVNSSQELSTVETSNISVNPTQDIPVVTLKATLPEPADFLNEGNASQASFDCEILNAYKSVHQDDPNLSALTDREIILQLGKQFEEMGYEMMESISIQDPVFMRYYQSLK
tara:strand:- start:666 stop:2039 length:1374 start_codon:yes stop_codon:yes gene_type:complete